MSPRPLPLSLGGPSPRGRWTEPCWRPGATRIFLRPFSVGTSMSGPRIASTIVTGTSASTLSPLRLKTRASVTGVIQWRSPGGPPLRPGSPLPASRTRLPSRTPAGIVTRYFFTVLREPVPPQVGQGSSITVPLPPQREQGWEIENRPCEEASTPRPWQAGQIDGAVPGLAPEPWQVTQGADVGTEI